MEEKTYEIRLGKKYSQKSEALIKAALESQKKGEMSEEKSESSLAHEAENSSEPIAKN